MSWDELPKWIFKVENLALANFTWQMFMLLLVQVKFTPNFLLLCGLFIYYFSHSVVGFKLFAMNLYVEWISVLWHAFHSSAEIW